MSIINEYIKLVESDLVFQFRMLKYTLLVIFKLHYSAVMYFKIFLPDLLCNLSETI